MASTGSAYLAALPGQLLRLGICLAILAALHFTKFLVIEPKLRYTILGVLIASALTPVRFSSLASGLGFLIVGGVSYWQAGWTLVTIACGVLGAWSMINAVNDLRRTSASRAS